MFRMTDLFVPGKRNYKADRCEHYRDLILKMAKDGCYLNEIRRETGAKATTIRKFLLRNGFEGPFPTSKTGAKCRAWKGGVRMSKDGYREVLSRDHPNCRKHTKYVLEHRLVMEKMIGRYLDPKEVVHHKDGNRLNNDPSNLQLFSENREHLAYELKGRVPKWSPEGYANMCKPRPNRKSPKAPCTQKE